MQIMKLAREAGLTPTFKELEGGRVEFSLDFKFSDGNVKDWAACAMVQEGQEHSLGTRLAIGRGETAREALRDFDANFAGKRLHYRTVEGWDFIELPARREPKKSAEEST